MISVNDFSKKQILVMMANQGDKLSFRNDNILICDKEGTIKCQSTCYRLFAIYVLGNLSITTGLIQRARKFGFYIVLFSTSFRVYQIIGAPTDGNTILKKKQYDYSGIEVARHIATNKMRNQQQVLKSVRHKSDYVKEAIEKIEDFSSKALLAEDIQSIMGYEGNASRLYFQSHFNNVVWQGRKPRIKIDMVNSLLDIGYTILFNYIETILNIYGFDLYVGVLHRNFYMRKSLVCDLVEPFRVLVDVQTKKSINLGQFKEEDFIIRNNRWELNWKKSGQYTAIYLQAILAHKEDIFRYIQGYYRSFMQQKSIDDYPVYLWQ